MPDDLDVAAREARYLASTVSAIRALPTAGASEVAITRLDAELKQRFEAAYQAIMAVAAELRLVRDRAAKFGDIIAPTAHEAALEMVLALNRERFGSGFQIIGRKCIEVWPNADEVIAEIDLETTKARARRAQAPAARVSEDDQFPSEWTSHPAWEKATVQQRKVLRFMNGRESVSLHEFVEAVWEGDSAKDGAVKAALFRANDLLNALGDNRTLEQVRGKGIIRWA
jgi:hypothetical protein